MRTIYVEKRSNEKSEQLKKDILMTLGIDVGKCRKLIRYFVEGLDDAEFSRAVASVFSEPALDDVHYALDSDGYSVLVAEYLDGQFDQRQDSAEACVSLLLSGKRPRCRTADVYLFGKLSDKDFAAVKNYLINPVDSREGNLVVPETLERAKTESKKMRVEIKLISLSEEQLKEYYERGGFAMSYEDMRFVRDYFAKIGREPTETEIKVIDTYWSDHCRHTTFSTKINTIKIISPNENIERALSAYADTFNRFYKGREDKYPCLMSLATIAAKEIKRRGYLDNLDTSDEINACSVVVNVDNDGTDEEWLIMFKNETHNHPTEIEPFGGAATCLGGAIRDPLSGRTYVYQSMRLSGAGDITESFDKTMKGKLPQRVISKKAAAGFSSYGNQIGLATGIVREVFSESYKAKRLETGYVIGGAKRENVVRLKPKDGDIVIMLGGDTGRDGCGGATGSSKAHNLKSVDTCGAEVQKGNAPEERKLQRLYRRGDAAKLIIKCNDFGAGGVSVAIGELADGLTICLDKVRKKYDGLTATELAISESQERMAVVVHPEDADKFIALAEEENLRAVKVACVTEKSNLTMTYGEETIVDIEREFLDTNGVRQETDVIIEDKAGPYFTKENGEIADVEGALCEKLSMLNVCSEKGLGEMFDSTIGAASVLLGFGGKYQLTPSTCMAAKPPVETGNTKTVTFSSYALYTDLMSHSPFVGAQYSVIGAVSKLVASGAKYTTIRLTLQEFFKKLGKDEKRWGEPTEALLGAFDAQLGLNLAAIGGKDSMSGSFENIDVPPTLIAFAMGVGTTDRVIHNAFEKKGRIFEYKIKKDEYGSPDYAYLISMYKEIEEKISSGEIINSCVVEEGGRAVALVKSLLGNRVGAKIESLNSTDFAPDYGNILVVVNSAFSSKKAQFFGEIGGKSLIIGENLQDYDKLTNAFTSKLESVYPTKTDKLTRSVYCDYYSTVTFKAKESIKPRIIIPVFPGTNCELDTARAFNRAGGDSDVFVLRTNTPSDIADSISELARRIRSANIIAFPGGFSGGDEPDGSGKFIASTFKNSEVASAVEELLYKRDGLALGICNGFQALIKLGLLPYGRISDQKADSPTLTFNDIGRHISSIVRIRVSSNASPWLSGVRVGSSFSVPISHGEGKIICNAENFKRLAANGQIATQYADLGGNVAISSPFNPNGSDYAIEGLISPDGRVLGKMGHAERIGKGLYQNVTGDYDMKIFESGINYYK